jgi:hypothetical protein
MEYETTDMGNIVFVYVRLEDICSRMVKYHLLKTRLE